MIFFELKYYRITHLLVGIRLEVRMDSSQVSTADTVVGNGASKWWTEP